MKNWILGLILAVVPAVFSFSANITFPEINTYSEYKANNSINTSYRLNLLFDTGLKYGLSLGLGFKAYNISSFDSNLVMLSAFKVYAKPFDLFYFGYFLGENVILGNSEIGYRGFQFHQRSNLEYVGYKTITGNGIELYMDLLDGTIQPHLYVYQPKPLAAMTALYSLITNNQFYHFSDQSICFDCVTYLKMEHYTVEAYFGGTYDTTSFSFSNALPIPFSYSTNMTNIYKHFGLFIKTSYAKIDFMMGLYVPDTGITNVPSFNDIYLNITEHINVGYFEQTLAFFTRPSEYNGTLESITNDLDIYAALGAKIDDVGFGVENTVLLAANYYLTDRVGGYLYFNMNNLQYKLGGYYNLLGNAFDSPWGGFISINGKL